MSIRFFALLLVSLAVHLTTRAQTPVVFRDSARLLQVGEFLDLYIDSSNTLTIDQVRHQDFKPSGAKVPNLQITPFTSWARIHVTNETPLSRLLLEVEYPTIDEISLYEVLPGGGYKATDLGQFQPYKNRPVNHQNYIFPSISHKARPANITCGSAPANRPSCPCTSALNLPSSPRIPNVTSSSGSTPASSS